MATRKPRKSNPPTAADVLDEIVAEETGLPAELRAEFVQKHAGDVLEQLFRHAHNYTSAAQYLGTAIFGNGGWATDMGAFTTFATVTPEAIRQAMDRTLDNYVAARIDAPTAGLLQKLLAERLDALAAEQPST